MKKLRKRILEIAILLTVVSSILPFFCNEVSAESVGGSSPIIGVNITYVGYDGEVVPYQTTVRFDTEQTMWRCTSSHSTMGCQVWESQNINGSTLDEITGTITTNATSTYTYRLYQYEFIFDKSYVGSITFNGNHPGATTTTTYYVNGERLVLTDINLVTSFTIGSYDLTYVPLEVLNQMKQWSFPIESFSFVYKLFKSECEVVDLVSNNYFSYPIFKLPSNSYILKSKWSGGTSAHDMYIIFGINKNVYSLQSLSDYFILNNINVLSFEQFNREDTNSNTVYTIVKIKYNILNVNNGNYGFFVPKTEINIMPIYSEFVSNSNRLTTDFALYYGLSNQLLDDLHVIAQGTQSSNQSGSNLEDKTDDINDISDQMFQLEDSFNDDLQDNLQQINTNFDVGNQFGSKFLYSANWVRTQFNNLTNLNPFGSLLSFSLLLGIGLLIIGKVLG